MQYNITLEVITLIICTINPFCLLKWDKKGLVCMIKIKLSDMLGKHKMTQKTLAELTGIRPATISKMYYEEIKRIEISQIDSLCKVFECEVSDLFEYIPD